MEVEVEVEAEAYLGVQVVSKVGQGAVVPEVGQGAVVPEVYLEVQVALVQQEVWEHPLPTGGVRRMKRDEPYARPSSLQQLWGLGQ